MDPVPIFNWVFEYQLIELVIFNHYKRAESNLLADEKGLQHCTKVVVWVIHLYLKVYCSSDMITALET